MKAVRFARVLLASIVALTTALSTFLVGCATKAKGAGAQGPNVKGTEGGPQVCDPVPPPPVGDPVLPGPWNNMLFEYGKADLSEEARTELDKLVETLKGHKKDAVVLEGHTCNAGSPERNMELGQRRADAAKAYLVEQGIAAERIQTRSQGESQPSVPNDTLPNKKLNRRVTIEYIWKD